EQCEELRLQWMKKHQKELCKDRLAQLALKDQLRQRWREEERMFSELWEEDRLAKEKREAAATQKSAEQSREVLKALGAQVAALSAHKEEAERLKEEEARWLEEEQRQLKLENERLQIVKLEKQKERRETLLSAAWDKTNRLTEEKEGELALEVKLLEQSLREPQEDAEEKAKRKQELFKEQQAYLAHLAKQLEEDKQREKEADKLLEEETAKVWAKKAEQMRSEKEARKQLLKDVLSTRQAQVEEKLQRNTKEQEELAQEQKLLAEAVAELERTEEEKYARKLKEAKEHQEQLRAQIAQRQQARATEEEEKQREYEAVLAAERAFRERVQDLLARPCESGAKTHPLRRKLASSSPDDPSR
ncbi:PREDICTED: coiled-coil domain-containing protein 11, partial [Buceros rhinoceros silvestris]|uniref:coiled-coil domain-containing protein 11 n=1 Tax=Buceros rhinoceros silvestris TaxID=175836 RepID=UPI0005293DA8